MSAKIPPKPTKDVIYIDVDDEITSIIDKVENSPQKVIALVLPKRAASLQSIVNMKLLKRSADGAKKNVVLITSEAALLPLAGAAGLHVAKNLQSAPAIPDGPAAGSPQDESAEDLPEDAGESEEDLPDKIDYNRPVGSLVAKHEADHPETIDLDDEEEAEEAKKEPSKKGDKGIKVPNFDRFRMLIGLGILGIIALIIFIFMAIAVLPKATITIETTSEPVTSSFNLTAAEGAAIDAAKGTVPAKLQSADQTGSQQVTATGQQNNGDKAKGSVSMTAKKCSGNPFETPSNVPAGTGISYNGQNYITQDSLAFHGTGTDSSGCFIYGSNGSSGIVAQSGGAKYNVSNVSFSVAGRSDVSASGSASGGTDNIVTILSQADVDGAKQKLTTGTTADEFTKSFEKKLSDQGEYILTSTLKAGDPNITAAPAVGQPASNATVTIKTTYTVLTIKKDDLSKILQEKLAQQVDKKKQKLSDSLLADSNIAVQSQSAPNSAVLKVNVDTTAVPILSANSVKAVAKGKKAGDIRAAIGDWAGVKDVQVKMSPFWVSKAPSKDSKITVVIKQIKASNSGQ